MQLNPTKYKSIAHTISSITANNGVRGLYFGMPAMLTQVSAKAAIRFTAFEQYKALLKMANGSNGNGNGNEMFINFVSGLMAGFTEAIVWTTPTERLKVLRQNEITSGGQKYSSMFGGMAMILKEQGVSGLYRVIYFLI